MKKTVKPLFLRSLLSDHLADAWKLLSETSSFLSRTRVFDQYEEDIRALRQRLQTAGKDINEFRKIKQEIIELRKSLRLLGFDLSLAGQTLEVEGFRNDTAQGEGYRRLVVFFTDNNAFWLSGDDNHITLSKLLEKQIDDIPRKDINIRSKHYLWYLRKGNKLILSGSDTEKKEDLERLKAMAEANSLKILADLKNLK